MIKRIYSLFLLSLVLGSVQTPIGYGITKSHIVNPKSNSSPYKAAPKLYKPRQRVGSLSNGVPAPDPAVQGVTILNLATNNTDLRMTDRWVLGSFVNSQGQTCPGICSFQNKAYTIDLGNDFQSNSQNIVTGMSDNGDTICGNIVGSGKNSMYSAGKVYPFWAHASSNYAPMVPWPFGNLTDTGLDTTGVANAITPDSTDSNTLFCGTITSPFEGFNSQAYIYSSKTGLTVTMPNGTPLTASGFTSTATAITEGGNMVFGSVYFVSANVAYQWFWDIYGQFSNRINDTNTYGTIRSTTPGGLLVVGGGNQNEFGAVQATASVMTGNSPFYVPKGIPYTTAPSQSYAFAVSATGRTIVGGYTDNSSFITVDGERSTDVRTWGSNRGVIFPNTPGLGAVFGVNSQDNVLVGKVSQTQDQAYIASLVTQTTADMKRPNRSSHRASVTFPIHKNNPIKRTLKTPKNTVE